MVEKLTAAGLNADAVAQIINVNRNTLRAEHALALANGRATLKKKKAEEAANELTLEELHALDSIESSFQSKWFSPAHGNGLWHGLSGGPAVSPADAFAKWQLDGAHFTLFSQIKREAERLLASARPHVSTCAIGKLPIARAAGKSAKRPVSAYCRSKSR